MVTKQQQLEWLANNLDKWKSGYDFAVVDKHTDGSFYVRWPSVCSSGITKKEWQQERDKMNSKPEVASSWYEHGELPPVGVPVELWFGGSFAYNCEFISTRGYDYVLWNLDDDKPDCADSMNSQFRPLRTEREKAIEDMSRVMHEHDSIINDDTLGALYDAGYRKVKP